MALKKRGILEGRKILNFAKPVPFSLSYFEVLCFLHSMNWTVYKPVEYSVYIRVRQRSLCFSSQASPFSSGSAEFSVSPPSDLWACAVSSV